MDQYKKILIIALCVVCICAVSMWFLLFNQKKGQELVVAEEVVIPPLLEPKQIDENNKMYLNRLLRFSLIFPKTLEVREYADGNTSTIVFENTETHEDFQVFVVPYDKEYIDDERFNMDVPSGIIRNTVDILIDNHPAIMFESNNGMIGDTREVWFIRDGFLYEITTRKDLDKWLSKIISNWKFI